MSKKLLFIRTDNIQIPDSHVEALNKMVKTLNISVVLKDIQTIDEIKETLTQKYKYICFAGHGDTENFGNSSEISIPWSEIGKEICLTDALLPNSKIILDCCFGGLKSVACSLMNICSKIDYVIGSKNEIHSIDMLNATCLFIYNIERNFTIGDEKCGHRVLYGTGIKINHFSRSEYDNENDIYFCPDCEQYNQ